MAALGHMSTPFCFVICQLLGFSQVKSICLRSCLMTSTQFFLGRPGFLLQPFSSHCVAWRAVLEFNYSVSQKKSTHMVFWNFFPNGWEFLINFLHTYYTILSTLDYKFYSNISDFDKLCHTKHDHPDNFQISLELYLLSLLTVQMTSLLTSCHIQHVCWHYKSVYFIVTCHRQRSTKLSMTYENAWMRAFWPMVDIWACYVNWVVALNMA